LFLSFANGFVSIQLARLAFCVSLASFTRRKCYFSMEQKSLRAHEELLMGTEKRRHG
jgi:hypothetical protein